MTPEDVLGALVTHSQKLDFGCPDPLIMEAREQKIGKTHPINWRLLGRAVDEHVELWPATPSALGKQTRARSSHSIAEIAADALTGMYDRNWQALQISIGVGDTVRPVVVDRLTRIAYQIQKRERIWPKKIKRKPCPCGRTAASDYVPDLVELCVRHFEDPWRYQNQKNRAEYFGLSESHWFAVGRRPFDQVAAHVWSWYYAGIGHIQHRIIQRRQRPAD